MMYKLRLIPLYALLLMPFNQICAQEKNKHLVDSNISELERLLETEQMSSIERKKLEAHLRNYFKRALHGKVQKKDTPLDTVQSRKIATTIKNAYQKILNTAGNHSKASKKYALQAVGSVALYVRPEKRTKVYHETAPVGATAVKSKGWLEEAEAWVTGGKKAQPAQLPAKKPVTASTAKPVKPESKTVPQEKSKTVKKAKKESAPVTKEKAPKKSKKTIKEVREEEKKKKVIKNI